LKSAALFNDQGRDLVDSAYAAASGISAGQVVGGCFCCRLSKSKLIAEIRNFRAFAPNVVLAEPVGSCTDLAATVLQPLRALLAEDTNPAMKYLLEKQIQEADPVCFTKSDLYTDVPQLQAPHVPPRRYPSSAFS
jgi:G3E family GTPase